MEIEATAVRRAKCRSLSGDFQHAYRAPSWPELADLRVDAEQHMFLRHLSRPRPSQSVTGLASRHTAPNDSVPTNSSADGPCALHRTQGPGLHRRRLALSSPQRILYALQGFRPGA